MELDWLYKWLIVISLFLIKQWMSQGTVLYDWNYSEVTVSGTSVWSEFNTSTYSYFYIKKSSNPTQTGNYNSQGYIGEDSSQSGWTATADNSYNTGDVSFTIYVYITDLTSLQYLYCKNYYQGAATRRAIWVGLGGSNTLFVEVNTSPTLTGNTVETITQPLTYTLGWNMIGWSSQCLGAWPPTANSGDKSIVWYNVMHDGSTSTTPSYDHTQRFVDDNSLTTWMAGVKQNINVSKNGLIGMVHELTQYSTRISLPDIQALLTNTWDWGWTSWLTNMAPTCLEYIKTAFIAQWDFSQPLYINTVYDQGSGGYNFKLLDNQASYDPIYVNNQGFYFDSNRLVRTTTPWIQSNQYSILTFNIET